MPINKNAYLRLKTIDALLARGVGYTKAEILVKIQDETGFEVSPFTFDKDLQLLRDNLHAPIEYTQRDGYHYSSKNFRLFSSVLNDEDVEALEFASDALNTLNVELAQEAQIVLMSIYARAKKQDSKPRKQIIFRPASPPVKGLESLSVLYKAIDEETAIVLSIINFKPEKPIRVQ